MYYYWLSWTNEVMKSFFPRLIDRCRFKERPCPISQLDNLGWLWSVVLFNCFYARCACDFCVALSSHIIFRLLLLYCVTTGFLADLHRDASTDTRKLHLVLPVGKDDRLGEWEKGACANAACTDSWQQRAKSGAALSSEYPNGVRCESYNDSRNCGMPCGRAGSTCGWCVG